MSSPPSPRGPSPARAGGHSRRDGPHQWQPGWSPAEEGDGRRSFSSHSSRALGGRLSSERPGGGDNTVGDKENRSNSLQLSSPRGRSSKPRAQSRGRSLSYRPSRPRDGRSLDHDDGYNRDRGSHAHRGHSLSSRRESSYHGGSSSRRRQESRTNSNDMFDDRRWHSSSRSRARSHRRHEGDGSRSSRGGHSRSRSSGNGHYPSCSSRHLSGSRSRGRSRDWSSGRSGGRSRGRSEGRSRGRSGGRGRSRSSYADSPDHRSRDYGGDGRGRHSKSWQLPDEDLHRSRSRGPSHYSGGDYGSLGADRRRGSDSSISSCKEGGKSDYDESVASSRQYSRDEFDQDNKRSASDRDISTADAKKDTNAKQAKNARTDSKFQHLQEAWALQQQGGSPLFGGGGSPPGAGDSRDGLPQQPAAAAGGGKHQSNPHRPLRFFNDGVEVDLFGNPLPSQPSSPRASEPDGQLSASRDSPLATPRSQSTATTGAASAQPWPYPSRGRLGNLTQVEPSGGGYPKMVEFPLFRVDGSQSGTHTVEILRVEHDPPIGGIKLGAGDVGKDWGRPGSALDLPQLCYLLKLSERCPRKVIKDRTIDLIKKRCPTTPMEIDASNPGSFLGTDWDGKLYWLGSRMPEGLNWLHFLLAQAQGDHGIPASSPIFRQADTNRNIFRAMEHFSHHDLHFAFVNNQVKASHSVYHPLDLGAINEEGNVMTGEMLYSNEDSARTRFARWGINPLAFSASLSSTSISALNMIEYHAGRSGFEAKMRSMSDDAKFQFIAQSVAAAYASRKPDPSKLVEEYGDAALALIKENDPEITSTLDELWALHEESPDYGKKSKKTNEGEGDAMRNADPPGQQNPTSDDQGGDASPPFGHIENESRHLDVDVRPLEQLLTRLDACTDEDLLIPAETSIIRVVQLLFSRTFDSAANLHRIPEQTNDFIRIIGPLSNYCKVLAPRLRSTADEAQLTPNLSTGQSIGAMLLECESSQKRSPGESVEVSKQLLELKKALYRHKNGDKSTHKNYEKAIKDATLYDFIRVCNPTKNHVTFVLHLAFVYHFICDMTVFEGIDHLGKSSTRLWARLEKFAAKVDTDVPFNRGTTILAFLVSFVSPSIDTMDEDQLWVEASILTCEVFSCLTQIQTKNLARHGGSANVDPRQERLLGCCRGAESNVVGGGSALGQIEDDKWYCSGLGEKQGDRRMRAFRTFLCMLLKKSIQRRLPPNFFSKRGYTRTFLRLSAAEYRKHGTFLTQKFFESNQGMNSKFAQGVRKGVVQKKVKGNDDDTGEQNIVISNREQVSSLRRLVEAVSVGTWRVDNV